MSKTNSYLLENWCVTICQQQASGMKITAWCNKNNVSLKNFTRWKTKMKRLGIDLHLEAENIYHGLFGENKKLNSGEVPQYYVGESHEAIIDPDI